MTLSVGCLLTVFDVGDALAVNTLGREESRMQTILYVRISSAMNIAVPVIDIAAESNLLFR
jgi:hypothetical protein